MPLGTPPARQVLNPESGGAVRVMPVPWPSPSSLSPLPSGVEALVGWLLDHSDVQGTDLSDGETGSEDGSDDDDLVEDMDDAACAAVGA